MDLGLTDRVYLVTGATRGLGYATARALVDDGAKVIITGRTQETADRAAAELGGAPAALGVAADNADADTPERLLALAMSRHERLDGVLISVGGPPAGTISDTEDEQWRDAFESVFLGALRLARTASTALGAGGVLAFVLSGSVKEPIPALGTSNGLRPGLAMAAKSLANELGPRGIRVLGLMPGRIGTDRITQLDALAENPDAARAQHCERIALRRYGEPEEFGRVAAFALSPAASYLSGVMLPVDGGGMHGI